MWEGMVAQEKRGFCRSKGGKKKGGNQKKTPGPIQTPFNDGITIHKNFTFPSPLLEPEEGERTRKGLKMLRRGREGELSVSLTVKRVCARVCLLCLCVLPDFPSFFFFSALCLDSRAIPCLPTSHDIHMQLEV